MMTLDEIFAEYEKDVVIDITNLANESLNIPKLHIKYYRMYSTEKMLLKKMEADLVELKRLKNDYYSGSMDFETLKELGWKPFQLKVLRSDLSSYINSDKDIINKTLKMAVQQEKLSLLEDILKTIHTRNFLIKNAIDVQRFQAGL